MIDCALTVKKDDTSVFLFIERYTDGSKYVMTVLDGQTKTTDRFSSFREAFDSFFNTVKTLEKGADK